VSFAIFLATAPGLEDVLAGEAAEAGLGPGRVLPGGVEIEGGWPEVWRANLAVRGANRVLARIGEFRAVHLAQLDKRARKIDWGAVLRADVPVRVEATCRRSKIYHAGAATQRIARAITEELGAPEGGEGAVRVMARIEDDLVTLSVDTSGAPLHRRGHSPATGKAPLRETLAALFLRRCGYDGSEPVLDPMCGAGTFPIEAAEIARGLAPAAPGASPSRIWQLSTPRPGRPCALSPRRATRRCGFTASTGMPAPCAWPPTTPRARAWRAAPPSPASRSRRSLGPRGRPGW